MADLSDVSNILVELVAQTLYPNGTANLSVTGDGVKAFGGWPSPKTLDEDLKATPPVAQVSIWPRDEEKNTTRHGWDWHQPTTLAAATVTASMSGQAVTFGGTGATGQNVAVLANGQAFLYAVQASDTPTSIATALAALIIPTIPGTTSAGAVLTFPTSARLTAARVGVTDTMLRILRLQEKRWQVSVWAAQPAIRDRIASAIDAALAGMTFLSMPDGTMARIRYVTSHQIDAQQREGIYRRDLFYTVEHATTQTTSGTQVLTEQINVGAQDINQNAIGTATVNL